MSDRVLVKQLRAIRDMAEAGLELLGEGDVEPAAAGPCKHPKERRRPAGVMGDPDRFFCVDCQEFVHVAPAVPPAPAVEG